MPHLDIRKWFTAKDKKTHCRAAIETAANINNMCQNTFPLEKNIQKHRQNKNRQNVQNKLDLKFFYKTY